MVTHTPAYRSIEWAVRLCWTCLAVVIAGCCMCLMLVMPVSHAVAQRITLPSAPSATISDREREEWYEQTAPVRSSAYHASSWAAQAAALIIALPVAVLLLVIIFILSRARWQMIRQVQPAPTPPGTG